MEKFVHLSFHVTMKVFRGKIYFGWPRNFLSDASQSFNFPFLSLLLRNPEAEFRSSKFILIKFIKEKFSLILKKYFRLFVSSLKSVLKPKLQTEVRVPTADEHLVKSIYFERGKG